MEIFHAYRVEGDRVFLDAGETAHCVRVKRHREGDAVEVIDGSGDLLRCRLDSVGPGEASATVLSRESGFGAHPYRLTVGVCPTKNADRYEWFVEKATEIGVDVLATLFADRSERRVMKGERLRKLALSAAKQSLKGAIPSIPEPVTVKDFIRSASSGALKLIACCYGDRIPLTQALAKATADREIIILIGPEGDFSPQELKMADEAGFVAVSLGDSRLRTETAALASVCAVYFNFCK